MYRYQHDYRRRANCTHKKRGGRMKRHDRFLYKSIGTYILLSGIWMLFCAIRQPVLFFKPIIAGEISIDYILHTIELQIGGFISAILLGISGCMYLLSFIKLKSSKYIIYASLFGISAYLTPVIIYLVFYKSSLFGHFMFIPIIALFCGIIWHYMRKCFPNLNQSVWFPFMNCYNAADCLEQRTLNEQSDNTTI